ncbi:MAG: EF-hand domain-containing protein [Akkermansiaceae bacterium]
MRFLSVISLILSVSYALGEGAKRVSKDEAEKGKKREKAHTSQFFENLDADQDGKVTREEFDQARRVQGLEESVRDRLFARLDKNSDGMITRKEIKPAGKEYSFPDPGKLLRQADKNKDRRITKEEFAAYPRFARLNETSRKRLFDRLDRNKDGVIDPKDRPKGYGPGGPGPGQIFRKFDINQDEKLSYREFLEMPHVQKIPEKSRKKSFDRLDQDSDGLLHSKEFRAKASPRHRQGTPREKPAKAGKAE